MVAIQKAQARKDWRNNKEMTKSWKMLKEN